MFPATLSSRSPQRPQLAEDFNMLWGSTSHTSSSPPSTQSTSASFTSQSLSSPFPTSPSSSSTNPGLSSPPDTSATGSSSPFSTIVTSVPVTITLPSTTLTSFSLTTFTTSGSAITSGTALPDSGSGSLSTQPQPICVGDGLDASATGLLATLIIPSAVGFLIWMIFAILRPHYRQVYAVREWFTPQGLRPRPLRDTLWAFLFPHVPFVPSVANGSNGNGKATADDVDAFPSDGELNQRVLWISFLIALGWAFLGLAGALPLYLVDTPCLANSVPRASFTGVYSTLQDLSLLRLLQLLDDGDVTTTSSLKSREVVNGQDFAPNVRIRLIILTIIVLVLAMLPALYKILKEFNRLVAFRWRWMDVRCEGVEMGWLSARRAPGFVGWGEKRLKDHVVKTGLSGSLEQNGGGGGGEANMAGVGSGFRAATQRRSRRNGADFSLNDEEKAKLEVDIQSLFSIGETHHLALLIDERDEILNNLEAAEARYISSFRLSTPDPSIAELPIPPEASNNLKQYISRPRALAGSSNHRTRSERHRHTASAAPTAYVAPSQYYKLRGVSGVSGGRITSDSEDESPSFGDTIHQRVVGTRFQEVNRDSKAFGRLPLGSRVAVDKVGELSPLPVSANQPLYGPNHPLDPSSGNEADIEASPISSSPYPEISRGPSGDTQTTNTPAQGGSTRLYDSPMTFAETTNLPSTPVVEQSDEMGVRRTRRAATPPLDRRETFAMRQKSTEEQSGSQLPPHLRLQPQQPFVRPISGVDHDDLGTVYSDIREWRSKLKVINNDIADAQNDCFNDIADGVRIKGWIVTGKGVRFLPGIRMIEGRSKEDIRWDELQNEGGVWSRIAFWTLVAMMAVILGAALIAVSGLAVATAPGVADILPFLQPLLTSELIASGLVTTLTPAVAATLFIVMALAIVHYAAHSNGSITVSAAQLTALKATFVLLTGMAAVWLIAVGALVYSVRAIGTGSQRSQSVANGSIYMSAFLLELVISAAIISPGLLLLQPTRLWRVLRRERQAVTPRQRFRAVYPRMYNPSHVTGCCVLAIVFASTCSLIFPLIGPAVVVLLFLTLVAHRFLVGYVYGRIEAQTGGLSQIWLLHRFGTLVTFQPILLGLILLTRRLWVEGGILVGVGVGVVLLLEVYASWKTRRPGRNSLSHVTRNSLETFGRTARPATRPVIDEESASLVSSQRTRPRGSIASVLEMMSLTLAVMPSAHQHRGPVPLKTEYLDDLTATERAARTHPDAPPHLPPLSFADHAEEMAGILYAPELIAPPPIIWLPNDTAGIARSEAYDLQRYHNLRTTLDVHSTSDVLPRRSSSSRARHAY